MPVDVDTACAGNSWAQEAESGWLVLRETPATESPGEKADKRTSSFTVLELGPEGEKELGLLEFDRRDVMQPVASLEAENGPLLALLACERSCVENSGGYSIVIGPCHMEYHAPGQPDLGFPSTEIPFGSLLDAAPVADGLLVVSARREVQTGDARSVPWSVTTTIVAEHVTPSGALPASELPNPCASKNCTLKAIATLTSGSDAIVAWLKPGETPRVCATLLDVRARRFGEPHCSEPFPRPESTSQPQLRLVTKDGKLEAHVGSPRELTEGRAHVAELDALPVPAGFPDIRSAVRIQCQEL